jgi:pimeloyl-ACP methyl ester carboxylesterase
VNYFGKSTFLVAFLFYAGLVFAQEKFVKANNINYYVYTKGFEKRQPNTPVLIFENGMGVGFGSWNLVLDQLSKVAPVFTYNRAGVEKSEKVFQMPTPKFVSENLKAILTELKIAPPYILVGHSMGGVYVRAFAGLYPNDVAGLAFVDPADFMETKESWKDIMRAIGVPDKRIDEMLDKRLYTTSQIDSARFGPWSELQVLTGLRKTDFAELHSLPIPNVPIYFFIGGRFEVPRDQWSKDYDHPAFFTERTNANILNWKKFIYSSSKGGSLIYLSNSGHYLHREDTAAFVANLKVMLESLKP